MVFRGLQEVLSIVCKCNNHSTDFSKNRLGLDDTQTQVVVMGNEAYLHKFVV